MPSGHHDAAPAGLLDGRIRGFFRRFFGFFGLFFGLFCSIPYYFIGGPKVGFAWWIAGIPYDLVHCVANFVISVVLFKPLDMALTKIRQSLKIADA